MFDNILQKKDIKQQKQDIKDGKVSDLKLKTPGKFSLDSADQFNKYVGQAIDSHGQRYAELLSKNVRDIAEKVGLVQDVSQKQRVELMRQVTEHRLQAMMFSRLNSERRVKRQKEEREFSDDMSTQRVKEQIRQDMASRSESDGRQLPEDEVLSGSEEQAEAQRFETDAEVVEEQLDAYVPHKDEN